MIVPCCLPAVNLWQYPEMAEKNSLFLGGLAASLSFDEGFGTPPAELQLDYLLPFGLPFSAGVYFKVPDPNLTSFGIRAAYHIDLESENIDLYVFYVFDLGFLRNDLLLEYGDRAQEIRRYDFRAGVRRKFGRFVCLSVESGFKLRAVHFGIALKLN
jgi:hypothetical protein